MPEPTTIASYSTAALDRDAAIESAGNHLVMNHVLQHDLRGEVAVDRELLQRGEGIRRATLGALHPVEGMQQCALIRGAEIEEDPAVVPAAPRVEVGQPLVKAVALSRGVPL